MSVTNVTKPVISDTTPQQGQTLSTTNGTWTFSADYLTYAYQWLRCDALGANCSFIGGATSAAYTVVGADVGSTLRSEVTATEHTTPVPPPGSLDVDRATMFSGGTILREDNSAVANPEPGLWGAVEYVFANCTLVTSGGDPRPKGDGTAQGNSNYRSLLLPTGYGGGDVSLHREQLGRNNWNDGENTGVQTSGTFALFEEGQRRIMFCSMRFPTGGVLMNQAGFQTIINFKETQSFGVAAQQLPGNAIEVNLYNNRLDFQNFWGSVPGSWTCPAPPFDTWIRFAFDVTYTQNPADGRIQYFCDHDGSGDFLASTKASPVFTTQTLLREMQGQSVNPSYPPLGDSVPCHFRIGIYNDPAYYLNRNNTVHVDNIQVMG